MVNGREGLRKEKSFGFLIESEYFQLGFPCGIARSDVVKLSARRRLSLSLRVKQGRDGKVG